MICFADSDFYRGVYLESRPPLVDLLCFEHYAKKATAQIMRYTPNIDLLQELPQEIRMCCCEVAELIFLSEKSQTETNGIESESVEGWSRHYESSQDKSKGLNFKIKESVYTWLSNTGLLFRGVN